MPVEFHPVTPERQPDLARFSAENGKFRYCSCMRWRMTSSQFQRSTKDERVVALASLVEQQEPVGVLAYVDGEPVGWCSLAPRPQYAGLERYKALSRLDDEPVWSVVCFYINSRFRRLGLTLGLLQAAVAYAVSQGAHIVEGYPVQPDARLYTYMGSLETFRKAGFVDVTPEGRSRLVMRYYAGRNSKHGN